MIVKRRTVLLLPLTMVGCGIAGGVSERPYAVRRDWPLTVPHPSAPTPAPRRGGLVVLLRTMRPGPGRDTRGLQTVAADGSIRTAYYESWSVPPAEGVEDALRTWLAASGSFSAVVAPGSRLEPAITLETTLTTLCVEPASGVARAVIAVVAIGPGARLLQRSFSATARLEGDGPAAQVQAQLAALAEVFAQIEAVLRGR